MSTHPALESPEAQLARLAAAEAVITVCDLLRKFPERDAELILKLAVEEITHLLPTVVGELTYEKR